MEVKKAVQRLGWRFSESAKRNDLSFRLNEKDIQALEVIDQYVVKAQKQQFIDQELFGKLYIYIYMKVLEQDKSTVMDTNARRKIYNVLKKPISQLVDDFTESLNSSEAYSFLEEIGVDFDITASHSEVKDKAINANLHAASKNPENLDRLTGNVWAKDFVAECLEAEVNQAINYHTK